MKKKSNGWTIFWLILFFPVGLYRMWRYEQFPKVARIIITAVIGIGVIANMVNGEDPKPVAPASTTAQEEVKTDTPKQETTQTEAPKQETPKQEAPKELSKEGVSSDVAIKIGAVETKDTVGNEFSNEKAQGIFKIVEVSITNNQKDAITVDANSFKLVDDQGREFTYSTQAQTALDIANGGDMDFFLKQLNPGLTQTGKIVYDVPQDAKGLTMKARGGFLGKEITLKVE